MGTAFALTPAAGGKSWDYEVIYPFLKRMPVIGWAPFDTLTMDGAGNLYGGDFAGGKNGKGVLFELSPGAKHNWTSTVLHTFCSQANCSDGAAPFSNSVVRDAAGNIYGTTPQGGTCLGTQACGVLYKLAPDGRESVLHTFCSETDCADGRYATSGLTLASDGTLYGTTSWGGGNDTDRNGVGGGTIFSFDGKYHVLHSFCERKDCADGAYPYGPLLAGGAGHFYGITETSGSNQYGEVFEFTP
jgi:uncharacterized repeat protein (TIGR03803 family)